MRTTSEDRKKQYRIIFELLWEEFRVQVKEIAAAVGPYVVRNRLTRNLVNISHHIFYH